MRKLVDDIPTYSEEGRDAIELLHLDYVSFFFYFEDDHHESVYERLIEKLFPKINGVVAVICLGGKTKVLAKAKQTRFPGITSIFIVDNDYDKFLGKIQKIPDVFYFEKFSFENYLTEKNALINLCIDENSRELTKLKALSEYSDYTTFYNLLVNQLLKLTKIHLVVRQYSIPIETTKISCIDLLDISYTYPIPSNSKIKSYLNRVVVACASSKDKAWLCDEDALINEGERIFSTIEIAQDIDLADFCCGKHLLGCIVRYYDMKLNNKLNNLDPVSMYVRLLSHIDAKVFSKFKENIANIYKLNI